MENNQPQNSRMQSLAFFGSITASVTHEINNVIAIINELTGLLDDLRYSVEQGQTVGSERLKNIQERFAKQVSRGERIIKRLNKFAHTADEEILEFDLTLLLTNLAELLQRPADMKQVKIECSFPAESLPYTGNIFDLQHAIFRCIRLFLEYAEKDSVISVSVAKQADKYRIGIECPVASRMSRDENKTDIIRLITESLGGELDLRRDKDIFSFILILPVAQIDGSS